MSALARLYDALERDNIDVAAEFFQSDPTLDLLAEIPGKGKSVLQKLWEIDHERGDSVYSDTLLSVTGVSERAYKRYEKAYDKITEKILKNAKARHTAQTATSAAAAAAAAAGAPAALNASNAAAFPAFGAAGAPVAAPKAAPTPVASNTTIQKAKEFFALTVPLKELNSKAVDDIYSFLRKNSEFNPLTIIPELNTSVWHLLVRRELGTQSSRLLRYISEFYNEPTYNSIPVSPGQLMPTLRLRHYPTEIQKQIYMNLRRVMYDFSSARNRQSKEFLYADHFFFQQAHNQLKAALQNPETFFEVLKQYTPAQLISKDPTDKKTVLFPFSNFIKRSPTKIDDALLRASLEYILPGHSLDDICSTGKTNKGGRPESCLYMLFNYNYVSTVEYLLQNGYKTPEFLSRLFDKLNSNVFPAEIAGRYLATLTSEDLKTPIKRVYGKLLSLVHCIIDNYTQLIEPIIFSKGIFGLTYLYGSSRQSNTPLYYAAEKNFPESFDVLLSNLGADINRLDGNRDTLLDSILYIDNIDISPFIHKLLTAGAKIKVDGQNKFGITFKEILKFISRERLSVEDIKKIISSIPKDFIDKEEYVDGRDISLLTFILVQYPEAIPSLFEQGIYGLSFLNFSDRFKDTLLYRAAEFDKEASFNQLLSNLGADINSVDSAGYTVFFYLLVNRDLKYVIKAIEAGADPNKVVTVNGKRITPFLEIAYYFSRTNPKRALLLFLADLPSFDLDSNIAVATTFLGQLAPGDPSRERVQEALNLLKKRKQASVIYEGQTQDQLRQLNSIVTKPVDFSLCPVCLTVTNREQGCLYMSHNCSQTTGFYHDELYTKYKDARNLITWCTLCSRICFTEYDYLGGHHYHLKLQEYSGPRAPGLHAAVPAADAIDSACLRVGGGGIAEKYIRLHRLREYAYDLQDEVGKLPDYDARKQMVEEVWNAPLARNPRALKAKVELETILKGIEKARANAAAGAGAAAAAGGPAPQPGKLELTPEEDEMLNAVWGKYGKATKNFPTNSPANLRRRAEAAAAEEARLNAAAAAANIPRPNNANASLQPIDHASGDCAVCLETKSPVTQFRHKLPNGTVNTHADSFICRDCLLTSIQNKLRNRQNISSGFGVCPLFPDCTAEFWPQELRGRVPPAVYEAYRVAFNKKKLAQAARGGMRGGVRQVGGTAFLKPAAVGSIACTSPNGVTPTTCTKCKTRRGGRRQQRKARKAKTQKRH